MPRSRRPRTIGAEDALAERVRAEMSEWGLSYATLAKAMSHDGVDISASSLQKSFTTTKPAEDRRPVRVDELVALAHVFQTSVENLLSPRDWVDQEQVDKALIDMDRADRLLVEAVQTMLDAQIMLVRAAAQAPVEDVQKVVGKNTTYWWGTSGRQRIQPRDADKNATPISTQAIGRRLAQLKAVIHAIAVHWCQAEDLHKSSPEQSTLVIGSDQWDTELATALAFHDDPAPDDVIITDDKTTAHNAYLQTREEVLTSRRIRAAQ